MIARSAITTAWLAWSKTEKMLGSSWISPRFARMSRRLCQYTRSGKMPSRNCGREYSGATSGLRTYRITIRALTHPLAAQRAEN